MSGKPRSFLDGRVILHEGDCRDILKTIPDCSIDSIVCDPPYHLQSIVKRFGGKNPANKSCGDGKHARLATGFMSKTWDGGDIAFQPALWAEVLRVLKPGGYIMAFSGCRTYHRMACAIEDAGFITHPFFAWAFGSGFPKAHSVSKQIDRTAGADRNIVGTEKVRDIRNGHGRAFGDGINASNRDCPVYFDRELTAPATAAAREWDGWFYGTQSLKPAIEPVYFGQKPFEKGLNGAQNVLKWGTGAINVGACKIGSEVIETCNVPGVDKFANMYGGDLIPKTGNTEHIGRWPANLAHDGSDEVLACFPETGASWGIHTKRDFKGWEYSGDLKPKPDGTTIDSGSAARFFASFPQDNIQRIFYTSKAGADDRLGSKHPTVKPLDLIQYLVRLITPKPRLLCPICDTNEHGKQSAKTTSSTARMQAMRNNVQATGQSTHGKILQQAMHGCGEGDKAENLQNMRGDVSAKGIEPKVLREKMRMHIDSEESTKDEGLYNNEVRIQTSANAEPSSVCPSSRIHIRTSLGNGAAYRTDANERGSRPSQESYKDGQSDRESTINEQAGSRQAESAEAEQDRVSLLRCDDDNKPTCAHCGHLLESRGGVVLDIFAGTGTTGEACFREGFKSVLIEREAEYIKDIERRMSLVMDGPDTRAYASMKARNRPRDDGPLFGGSEKPIAEFPHAQLKEWHCQTYGGETLEQVAAKIAKLGEELGLPEDTKITLVPDETAE